MSPLRPDKLLSVRARVAIWIGYAGLALLALAVGLLLYWVYQPKRVLEIKNQPVPIRTIREHATADGVVILKVDYCKNVKAEGRTRLSFVSASREIFLPTSIDRQDPQCAVAEIPILLPHDIPADTYHIHFRVQYQINPLRSVIEEFDSGSFEVVDQSGNPTVEIPKQ